MAFSIAIPYRFQRNILREMNLEINATIKTCEQLQIANIMKQDFLYGNQFISRTINKVLISFHYSTHFEL